MSGRLYKRNHSPFYQIAFMGPDGNLYRETTKTKSKREAEQILKRRIHEVSSGAIKGLHYTTKLEDLIKLWKNDQQMKKRVSYEDSLFRLKYLEEFFSPIRVIDITPNVITRYILKRQNDGNASIDTINRELSLLRRLFHLAKNNDLISKIPKIEMLPGNHIRQGYVSKTEYETMIKHASPIIRPIIIYLYNTGNRLNEARRLKWSNVDLEKRIITFSPEEVKERTPRVVPINDIVYSLLCEIRRKHEPDPSSLVFCNSKGGTIKSLYQLWKKMLIKSNLSKKIIPHDLRRSFVINAVKSGIPETIIMSLVGHKTRSMFIRYAISQMEDKENAVKKISEFLSQN